MALDDTTSEVAAPNPDGLAVAAAATRQGGLQLTAAVSGLLLFATFLVGSFTPEGPTLGSASAAEIRTFAAEKATALQVAASFGVAVLVIVVIFTAALAQLARAKLPGSVLPGAIAAGGILIGAFVWLDTAAQAMTVLLPDLVNTELAKVDDTTVLSWYGLTGYTHFLGDLAMAPISLVMAGFSIAALRGGLLPRWLGWVGLALGVAGGLGVLGITTAFGPLYAFWFAALFGWVLWVLLVSIALGIRGLRMRRSPGAQPA